MTLGPVESSGSFAGGIETARPGPKHEKKESHHSNKDKIYAALGATVFMIQGVFIGWGIQNSIDKIEEYSPFADKSINPVANSEQMNTETTQLQSVSTETTFEVEIAETAPTAEINIEQTNDSSSESLSIKDFEALPLDVRLLNSQEIINQGSSKIKYNNKYGEGTAGHDFAVEYTPVSENNTGQQILNNQMYVSQIAYIQSELGDNGEQFDVTNAVKCISSNYYCINESEGIVNENYIVKKAAMETLTDPVRLININTAIDTSDLLDGNDANGDKIQYKIVTFLDQKGDTYNAKFIYHTFKNTNDTLQAIWLLENYY